MKQMKQKSIRIVAFGEVLFDKIMAHDEHGKEATEYVPGGAPLNCAMAAEQLTDGGVVSIISAVGNDDLGDRLMKMIDDRGVNNIVSRVSSAKTGVVDAVVDNAGVATYTIVTDVAYDHIPITPEAEEAVRNADAFIFGSLASRCSTGSTRETLKHLHSILPAHAKRVFDINLRPTVDFDDIIPWCLENSDILKLNEEELQVVASNFGIQGNGNMEEQCLAIMARFSSISMVILTMGAVGSCIVTADRTSYLDTPKVANLQDTIGCGDSFAAAAIVALCKGLALEDAHRLAVEVSSYTATQKGGQPLYPERLKQLF